MSAPVSVALAAAAFEVESFSPLGSISSVRQVTVRFSQPMTALGDPRGPEPFSIDCPAKGQGRWADDRNWVYDFDEELPGGVRCAFTLKATLKSFAGDKAAAAANFSFDTGGPKITDSIPRRGSSDIDENQVFLLALNAPATRVSIEANAYCEATGIGERIPVTVLDGAERAKILEQRKDIGYEYYDLIRSIRNRIAVTPFRVRTRSVEQTDDRVLVLRCQRSLPPATKARLVWSKGIASLSGVARVADQTLPFAVRPTFTARMECEQVNEKAGCLPMLPIRVVFSAPVPRARAFAVTLTGAGGQIYKPDPKDTRLKPTLEQLSFTGPFPEKAGLTLQMPAGLTDDAGRVLENAARFPLALKTDEFPPLAKFSAKFGILEASEGGILPVTLRNLATDQSTTGLTGSSKIISGSDKNILDWMQRVEKADDQAGEEIPDPKTGKKTWQNKTGDRSIFSPHDTEEAKSFAISKREKPRVMEVVGIPLGKPGFYVVEIASPKLGAALLGEGKTRFVSTAALVTNIAVHFNWGKEASEIWVTALDSAKPVALADITITDTCNGATLWTGKTDSSGLAHFGKEANIPAKLYTYCNSPDHPLMVSARKSGDMSFTLTNWNEGIQPYNFHVASGYFFNSELAHTIFDRMLFRAGETVSMKHYMRQPNMTGFTVKPEVKGVRDIIIRHDESDQTYHMKTTFDDKGIATSSFTIPKEAKLGAYSVTIRDNKSRKEFESGHFKVEEFRVPTMRALVQGPDHGLVNPAKVQLDLHVGYLSGGGASGAAVKLRTMVEPKPITFSRFADFNFGGEPVAEGVASDNNRQYDIDPEEQEEESPRAVRTQVLPLTLDGAGAARVAIPITSKPGVPSQLVAELEYNDANGEILTTSSHVPLWPAAISLGIRPDGWFASAEKLSFRVLAVDMTGRPVAGQTVTVKLYKEDTYSYRKRLIGGFYGYESIRDTKLIPVKCEGKTNAQGLLMCDVAPGMSGQIIVRAETKDAQGNNTGATIKIWAVGKEDWWFGGTAGDRMDLLPEKDEYNAGDVARFQVRMPFRRATALVTVEREGVISSFVTELSGKSPVIEVPIKDTYAPNIYVSVLTVRGRVKNWRGPDAASAKSLGADAQGATAIIDLAKPAFRLGLAKIRVGWAPHRLNVKVTPDRPTYKIRETAKVMIKVTRANGKPLPAGTEIALAAVDEGLLELAPNPSWALLDAMMGERNLDVYTSTAQMQVVGKRHYGRKAVPHGGGGGRESAREMFDTLLIWKGRVKLDENGEAAIEVPLNDSLTSFKIVAIASADTSLFGTGAVSIHTTQDLMVLPGLPALVREGDHFSAMFTVRNTSDKDMAVDVKADVTPAGANKLVPQQIQLAKGEVRDVAFDVTVPLGHPALKWDVSVAEVVPGGSGVKDHIRVQQKVIPAVPVRTWQATITQLSAPLSLPVRQPVDALPGRGGLAITLRPHLGDGLEGVRQYMTDYRYSCLEQNVSKAVALRDSGLWAQYMGRLAPYMDRDGLLKYFPSSWFDGDDVLTSYVLAIANEAGYQIPDYERGRLIEALTGFVKGKIIRGSALPTSDLAVRKIAAIEALSRYGAANPAMLDSISIEPDSWPSSAVIDWINILKRLPQLPNQANRLKDAEQILRARLNFQGTVMTFSTERSDALWWLMVSTDSNAVRAVLALMDRPGWKGDMPRLVRGALGRQIRGHWNTTVANAWGVLAMEKFSAAFEKEPVTGVTKLSYAGAKKEAPWKPDTKENVVNFAWGSGRGPLNIQSQGTGKPWVMIRAEAAIPLKKPFSSGYKIKRTVTAIESRNNGVLTRGDVMRVTLELEAQSDMTWVVLEDPVPGGATILGSGLGGQSEALGRGEQRTGYAYPAFEERRFDSFRAYYRFVPKGKWSLEYTVRLNNAGLFQLPPTHVEAMYAPEMLGELPNAVVDIKAAR